MRQPVDRERLERFMRLFGEAADSEASAYFAGGATAILLGWRESTIDVDLVMAPENEAALRSIPRIKEELQINVELASPLDFIPVPEGWQERSPSIGQAGQISFFNFDVYAQALAKIERSHAQDVEDVRAMLSAGLIEPAPLRRRFEEIEPELYRFPAIDPPSFRRALEVCLASEGLVDSEPELP